MEILKVGQLWITTLRAMWMDGWVMSMCTQDSQKVCTKLLSLPDNAKTPLNFSSPAKIRICTLSKAPALVWSHHQHTHAQNKYKLTYGFVLGPLQSHSTGQNTHLTSKTVILVVLAFKKYSTHLHPNQLKLSPVPGSSTHPLQNSVCFFPLTSRPGSYAHKPTPCHYP